MVKTPISLQIPTCSEIYILSKGCGQDLGLCKAGFFLGKKIPWKSSHNDIPIHHSFLSLERSLKYFAPLLKKSQEQLLPQNFMGNETKNSNYSK